MSDIETILATRLRALRVERGLTLDQLAAESGLSRGTLSRIETGETSPTAAALGRLSSVYGLPASRLLSMAEDMPRPLVRRAEQEVFRDTDTGFTRRAISPPAQGFAGNVIEGQLTAGAVVHYDRPGVNGLEHHIVLTDGALRITLDGATHDLAPGDCLRFRLMGENRYEAGPEGARYFTFFT